MEIYKIENLSFSYPHQDRQVLTDLSFSVYEGEFLTICGLSGSGKSTLLRHLKSALCPHGTTSGNVVFKNRLLKETDEVTQAKEIGFVLQSPDDQIVTDTVWHELAFGMENLGMPVSYIRRRVAEMAIFFGLTDKMYTKTSQLSGGQKQILNLASVMIQEPSVLILDEPMAQLDPVASEKFMTLLIKIHREFGTTIILGEHNLEQICTFTDRIAVINEGQMVFEGSPRETALELYHRNDPLLEAMPVSAKIAVACQCECGDVPMTIGEGKHFLSEYAVGKTFLPVEHDYRKQDNREKPVISLKNVFFRYEKTLPDILKGLSISAWKGEILAVTGSNGSGKTTLLHTIAGILNPYSGIRTAGVQNNPLKICLLPQDPRVLFLKDSVYDDLCSAFPSEHDAEECKKLVDEIMVFCGLEDLKKRHPYDLSGGEQQQVGLAKVLMYRPDILLLDEPVKGMDVKSKVKMGAILKSLANAGICVIMVSHDLEFCAEYADRCALIFDGDVISTTTPDRFFSDNVFFTTSAARMAENMIPNAVTTNDIRKALSVSEPKNTRITLPKFFLNGNVKRKSNNTEKKINFPKLFFGIAVLLFILFSMKLKHILNIQIPIDETLLNSVIMMLLSGVFFCTGINKKNIENITIHSVKRSAKYMLAEMFFIFTSVPITIYIGISLLGDAKYLFISLMIMLECTMPFFIAFEKNNIRTRELVLISVMCAMAVTSRAAFYMFPQFKPITAVVIVSGAVLGSESGFLIGALSMLISNVLFGQGPWTPWQMFSMGLIGFLSGVFFGANFIPKNKYSFSAFGLISSIVIYGGIMNPASIIMSHTEISYKNIMAFYVTGLPLDIVHGVSTAVFLFLAAVPIIRKIERVKLKYGISVRQN